MKPEHKHTLKGNFLKHFKNSNSIQKVKLQQIMTWQKLDNFLREEVVLVEKKTKRGKQEGISKWKHVYVERLKGVKR